MGFTTITFIFIFMPISIALYVLFSRMHNKNINNILLVVLSCTFYAWTSLDTLFTFILLGTFVFLFGNLIYMTQQTNADSGKQKEWVLLAVILLITILACYKYVPFILEQINYLPNVHISIKSLVTPLGISFIIFEAISYIVDIYRGDAKPGNLIETMLFLSLFPKIISGPIVLWKDFESQIHTHDVNVTKISEGINRIILGFAKKAIIADTFGAHIQIIESSMATTGVDTPTMWLRAVIIFFQIYYDFSGYSDIAIGLCNIFGFSINNNFNFPYISKSISEFWRRWHISLGSWFREYVYIPLGGNRRGNVYIHLFVVFLLTGVWHGANWTFVLWGAVNGLFVVLERFVRDKKWYLRIPACVKWMVTICIVFFLWILFMSPNIETTLDSYSAMFSSSPKDINFTWEYFLTKKIAILLIVACVGSLMGAVILSEKIIKYKTTFAGVLLQKLIYLMLFIIAILFVVNSSYSPFLYFQF